MENKDIKELQKDYDLILNEIKSLNDKKKSFEDYLKTEGLAINKKKIEVDKEVIGLFYDFDFYSHFDGYESEAIYKKASGAVEISKDDYNILINLIKKYKENGDEDFKLSEELCYSTFSFYHDYWEEIDFKFFKIDGDIITWEYKGNGGQSELVDGSSVIIKPTTKNVIRKVKTVSLY